MRLRSGTIDFQEARAEDIRVGMAMLQGNGMTDLVASVRRFPGNGTKVFDLDVHPTHNYVAAGLVTHNSIYRFRGAEVGNMNEFVRDFGVSEVIKLEQNYRSQGNILDAANAIIAQNKARLGKNLWTEAGKGEQLAVYAAANDGEESNFIVEEVRSLHREGYALSDMALLYRSNAQSRILEHQLFRAKVPYKVYGGLRFFERQEVKHALAYLRLAANADDDGAFTRVVNFPPRGIGTRSIEQLQEGLGARHGQPHACRKGRPRHRAQRHALVQFVATIESISKSAETLALPELIEEVLEKSHLNQYYAAEKDGQDRPGEPARAGQCRDTLRRGLRAWPRARGRVAGGRGGRRRHPGAADPGGLPSPREPGGGRARGLRRPGRAAADDGAFRQGAGVLRGLHLGPRGGPLPAREQHARGRRHRGGAPPHVRRHHPREEAPLPILCGQPHAARAAPLRHRLALRRGDPGGAVQVDRAAGKAVRPARLQRGLGRLGRRGCLGLGRRTRPRGRHESLPEHAARGLRDESAPTRSPSPSARTCSTPSSARAVVIDFKGRGLDASVQVRFRTEGTKWLALQFAKLTPG
jgi:hypothetical protein